MCVNVFVYSMHSDYLKIKKETVSSFSQQLELWLIEEVNISSVIFKGYENLHESCAVFHRQNAAGCELLLLLLRWRDRVLFANASWFVNKFLTTCIQINRPSSCHLALLSVIFTVFV